MHVDLSTDTHIHTSLCNHASGTMEEFVQAAISRGLKRMFFLEHLETGIKTEFRSWLRDEDFDVYFEEGRRLQEQYGAEIDIGLGVEVGYNPDCPHRILERLGERSWDRIGLSYHFTTVPGFDEHVNMLSREPRMLKTIAEYGPGKLLSRYFDTLLEAVRTIEADSLSHLDAGLRHQPDLQLDEHHWEQVEALLREVKRAGMALEINTSGYTYRGQPFPLPAIITMAQEMGIPFAAASDAHSPAEVGRFFDLIPGLLS